MKKFNTAPISGMQELTPALQARFDELKSGIERVFRAHGFLHIETPMIERTEVLLAKAGGETEKQIYKVVKTNETAEDADQALRFDHTVPLARYTVEHMNDLAFPFKVTQVGRNFRGERAQKGRFREFYQCDVDVVGREKLAVGYDAEVIATLGEAIATLPLPAEFVVRISNRKLLGGMLEELNLTEKATEIFGVIDHAEKVPAEKTAESLRELGLSEENVAKLIEFMNLRGERAEIAARLRELKFENEMFLAGVAELEEVLRLLEKLAPELNLVADMKIVRGLDYYTGTVFETMVNGYERQFGSICSGGRYENLAGYYTDQKLPGVGGSIGLTRLFSMLAEAGLVTAGAERAVEVCVVPISEAEVEYANEVAEELRAEGKTVDLVLSEKKLGEKMKYAGKIAQNVVVIGEEERVSGEWSAREL